MSLAEVYGAYAADPFFKHLRTEGINLVPGFGASRPRVLLVGEAPGATENRLLRPFCGASGVALKGLMALADIRLEEEEGEYSDSGASYSIPAPANAFITNVVKYRPPGNRTPTHAEQIRSKPYLLQEWKALGKPPVIVCVGKVAFNTLHPESSVLPMGSCTGSFYWPKGGVKFFAQYHPAYGLRNPQLRPRLERDWEAMGEALREEGLI